MSLRVRLLATSLCTIFLAHYLAVFVHEYAHSFVAFALGWKDDPFAIEIGNPSLANLLLLSGVDENVDYAAMFSKGAGMTAAFVGFAGLGLGNGIIYFASLYLMKQEIVQQRSITFAFVYWLNVMCVGNFYDYVPIRTFALHGDIAHITQGLAIPDWLTFLALGVPTLMAMWWLFARTMPAAVARLDPQRGFAGNLLVVFSVVIMFGYFGMAGWVGYGAVSHTLSGISILLIPIMLKLCARTMRAVSTHVADA